MKRAGGTTRAIQICQRFSFVVFGDADVFSSSLFQASRGPPSPTGEAPLLSAEQALADHLTHPVSSLERVFRRTTRRTPRPPGSSPGQLLVEETFYALSPSVVVIPATLYWLNNICCSWVHLYVHFPKIS